MSSSTLAVQKTLDTIRKGLEEKSEVIFDLSDYLDDDEEDSDIKSENASESDFLEVISDLKNCISISEKIQVDQKSIELLKALEYSYRMLEKEKTRNKKILIFTESTNTQSYLVEFLNSHGYNSIVTFNGSNNDSKNSEIFRNWIETHNNEKSKINSKSSLMRQAIIDSFKDEYEIMIATEAAAEGLNLQFCSIIMNYDLPWNPQRVEQRIGRCHRYGQENDVVVINFLNKTNIIDKRVYELLSAKLLLFNDVFGTSDEILGEIDDSIDLQSRIIEIYKSCRSPQEINDAFDNLQGLFKTEIDKQILETRQQLLDNFDEDIQLKFDSTLFEANALLDSYQYKFWRILKFALNDYAIFNENKLSFEINAKNRYFSPGQYTLDKVDSSKIQISPFDLGFERILNEIASYHCVPKKVVFDLSNYNFKITELEAYKSQTGQFVASKIEIDSFENEQHIILDAIMENGTVLDTESCEKLLRLYAISEIDANFEKNDTLLNNHKVHIDSFVHESSKRNRDIFNTEMKNINVWADDMIGDIQLKVSMLREERKEKQRIFEIASTMIERDSIEKEISNITLRIKKMWLELSDMEDTIESKRSTMISRLKKEQMKQIIIEEIFCFQFEVL